MPPTFVIKDTWEDDLQGLTGLDSAIAGNELISESRKEFLLDSVSRMKLKPAAPPKLWERFAHELWENIEEPDMIEPEPPDPEPPDPDEPSDEQW